MTAQVVQYRLMHPGEEKAVIQLVKDVFGQFEAGEYTAEGMKEFFRYANVQAMRDRATSHFVIVAIVDQKIIGMIEIRNNDHVALFFVDSEWHYRGIGQTLFEKSMKHCQDNRIAPKKITVNSSPYALGFYQAIGFSIAQSEQQIHGIRFIPMEKALPS